MKCHPRSSEVCGNCARFSAIGSSLGQGTPELEEPRGAGITKEQARGGLRRLQTAMGLSLLVSAGSGAYLLATDRSLWLLAFSHAVGLIMIVVIDAALGLLSISSSKKGYLPSIAAAVLGLVLQLGDVFTGPQYNMSISYFASYLFGLWAFDILLALQVVVIVLGVAGRPYAQYLARVKTRRGRELNYSRRTFVRAIAAIAGLIGIGVVAGSVRLPAPISSSSQTSTTTQTGVSKGAIANTNNIQVGQPVYFDYPTGYPNILMKNADGSLTALSLLCTHVCCHCSYDGTSKAIRCPCHGSVFDLSGQVVSGPAVASLSRIQLNVDNAGNVFPVGVSNPGPCHV